MWRWATLLLALSATAAGQSDAPDDWDMCRNGLFPTEPPFAHARVTGPGRLRFLGDMDGCPDKGRACATGPYVIEGDEVLTSKVHGAYTCAFYPSKRGGTAGWVETARLNPLPVEPEPEAEDWIGKWSSEGNPEINIRLLDGKFEVGGESYWPSPDPPIEQRPGGPNMGFIKGPLRIEGHRAQYANDYCEIEFTLIGDFLFAGDNRQCGGMNVSFSSVYRRISLEPDECDAIDYIDGPPRCSASGELLESP
jgi:hypothetical protein